MQSPGEAPPPDEASLGDRVDVEVLEVAKWSAKGRVVGRPARAPHHSAVGVQVPRSA